MLAKQAHVELERAAIRGLAERAARATVCEERRAGLEPEHHRRHPLVRGQEDREAPAPPMDRAQALVPSLQCRGHGLVSSASEQVAAIEEEPRVHIPRHAVGDAIEHVRVPDAAEDGGAREPPAREPRIERRQGPQRAELRDPAVPELAEIGERAADVRGEQLLVRCGPRDLLHAHVDPGVLALEVTDELAHDLALASHGPHPQLDRARPALAAASGTPREQYRDRDPAERAPHRLPALAAPRPSGGGEPSQPPRKPPAMSPRRTY